ncbi:hypothetical protein BH10PLA1_BH10PLA1_08330 [soil metagenome]
MVTPPTVCVITGATGHKNLRKCIESVQEQSYAMIEHLVVTDGPERREAVDAVLNSFDDRRGIKTILLPHITGKNRWNAHRIYGGMPSIAMTDYVVFLDEDNWFDQDHVESLVASVQSSKAVWSFALRKLVDTDGNFVDVDQCESLGNLHPTFRSSNEFHIDANCYMLRRDVAIQLAAIWNRVGYGIELPDPDRLLCRVLMEHYPNGQSTRKFTVNYTVGNTAASGSMDYFTHGNSIMRLKYPHGYPWEDAPATS